MGVANIYSSLRGSSKALFSGGNKINSAVWGQTAGAKQQNSSARLSGIVLLLTTLGLTEHLASPWPGSCPAIHSASLKAALAGGSQLVYMQEEGAVRIESLTQNFINSRSVSPACLHSVRS